MAAGKGVPALVPGRPPWLGATARHSMTGKVQLLYAALLPQQNGPSHMAWNGLRGKAAPSAPPARSIFFAPG